MRFLNLQALELKEKFQNWFSTQELTIEIYTTLHLVIKTLTPERLMTWQYLTMETAKKCLQLLLRHYMLFLTNIPMQWFMRQEALKPGQGYIEWEFQNIIRKLQGIFEIFGERNKQWESFEKDTDYKAFLVRLK